MTIEITLDDLNHLAETARTNGHSVLYLTRTTDGKRCSLVVTQQAKRKRAPRAAKPAAAPEG
jgi:hypothetical protein